jgi:hypothetical protein
MIRATKFWRRQAVSDAAFEDFAQLRAIRQQFADAVRARGIRSVLLIDVGKNVLAYWLATQACGLRIVAIADQRLSKPGRRYRGISVVDDMAAQSLCFDAAVIANTSPVHAQMRAAQWRQRGPRPVINLFETASVTAVAMAA